MSDSWKLEVSKSEFTRINRELTAYFGRSVSQASAKDLAADTWVAITRWYRGRCSLRTYAFLVARKVVVNTRRKREREIMTAPLESGVDLAATGPGPHSLLMLVTDHATLDRALEQVDDVFRPVLRLWLAGRDNVQIAAELEMNYNTVRSQLRRGQKVVIAALQAEFNVTKTS
jgi:RNA polymerase sigma factor (sigma-70 family)